MSALTIALEMAQNALGCNNCKSTYYTLCLATVLFHQWLGIIIL